MKVYGSRIENNKYGRRDMWEGMMVGGGGGGGGKASIVE